MSHFLTHAQKSHFIGCCRDRCPNISLCITTPRHERVSTSAYLQTASLSDCSYVLLPCKYQELRAKRADGQTVRCPKAPAALVHAKHSCSTGQRSGCRCRGNARVGLPHLLFIQVITTSLSRANEVTGELTEVVSDSVSCLTHPGDDLMPRLLSSGDTTSCGLILWFCSCHTVLLNTLNTPK